MGVAREQYVSAKQTDTKEKKCRIEWDGDS